MNKKYYLPFMTFLVSMLIATASVAIPTYNGYLEPIHARIKRLDAEGLHAEAIAEAIVYLKERPTDGDVRLVLGQIYFNHKEYAKAREQLLLVLQQTPGYADASMVLINVEMTTLNYQQALMYANLALILNPLDSHLLTKRDTITQILDNEKTPVLLSETYPKSPPETAPLPVVKNDVNEYKVLLNQYNLGKKNEVMARAMAYLKTHPTDGDVRLLLARVYFDRKDYANSQAQLSLILQQTPHYVDAILISINIELVMKNYKEALKIANKGLFNNPNNHPLLLKKQTILLAMHGSHVRKERAIVKNEKKPEEKKYFNEVGIYQQQYYISDVKKIWDYTTVYYGRDTAVGKVYGKINYASRLFKKGLQGEVEAFPKINKNIYFDLDFAFGDEPNLFPNQSYAAEGYFTMDKSHSFSLGGRFNRVDAYHRFMMYTGTYSQGFAHDNRLTFRPFHFEPGVGQSSTLYTLDFRHNVLDPFFYWGCIIGAGSSPDLADLTTVNFIVVQNKLISPYLNVPLLQERLIVNLSLLYQNQLFPRGRVRNWSGGTIGLKWRY